MKFFGVGVSLTPPQEIVEFARSFVVVPAPMIVADPYEGGGRIVEASLRLVQAVGLSDRDAVGAPFPDVLDEEDIRRT